MTLGQNTRILILLGITLLLAVLFELVWVMAQSRSRNRWRGSGTPPAEKQFSEAGSPNLLDRLIREWNRKKGVWEIRWRMPIRVIRAILFCAILALAAVPSYLVVEDRWLNRNIVHIPLAEFRCKLPLLCSLELPPYFLFLVVCLLAAGLLIALFPLARDAFNDRRGEFLEAEEGISGAQIRISRLLRWASLPGFLAVAALSVAEGRIPGWELALVAWMYLLGWFLRDISFSRLWMVIRENREWEIPCLLFHVALVGALYVYFSFPNYVAVAAAGLALTGILLFRFRHRVPAIYWVFSLGLALFSINLNSWWVALTGDEYGFYVNAREILEKTGLSTIAARLFDEMGVYGQIPIWAPSFNRCSCGFSAPRASDGNSATSTWPPFPFLFFIFSSKNF